MTRTVSIRQDQLSLTQRFRLAVAASRFERCAEEDPLFAEWVRGTEIGQHLRHRCHEFRHEYWDMSRRPDIPDWMPNLAVDADWLRAATRGIARAGGVDSRVAELAGSMLNPRGIELVFFVAPPSEANAIGDLCAQWLESLLLPAALLNATFNAFLVSAIETATDVHFERPSVPKDVVFYDYDGDDPLHRRLLLPEGISSTKDFYPYVRAVNGRRRIPGWGGKTPDQTGIDVLERNTEWLYSHRVRGVSANQLATREFGNLSTLDDPRGHVHKGIAAVLKLLREPVQN